MYPCRMSREIKLVNGGRASEYACRRGYLWRIKEATENRTFTVSQRKYRRPSKVRSMLI
jgi:hypothetical protein